MRFFKIFIIVFFSLIGVFGATYGILTVTGYFNKEKVSPEDIYFDKNDEYNETGYLDENGDLVFDMKVLTATENVTEKKVSLEFDKEYPVVDGKISNGKIQIPAEVNIGETFKVKILQDFNEEINEFWTIGGSSVIKAKTGIASVTEPRTTVNIDVPVHHIGLKIQTGSSNNSSVAVGGTFTAEAEFFPAQSKYLYSKTDVFNS